MKPKINRRSFLNRAAIVAGGALTGSALSYRRILGANDRISLGHIGVGRRGNPQQAQQGQASGDGKGTHRVPLRWCDGVA